MERHLELLARLLLNMGHEAHLLTTLFPKGEMWEIDGIHIHTAEAPPAQNSYLWRKESRKIFQQLQARYRFEAILSEGDGAAGLIDIHERPPLAVFLQNIEPEHLVNFWLEVRSPADILRYLFFWAPGVLQRIWVERRLCRLSEKVWVASFRHRDWVVKWYGVSSHNVEHLPNWIEDDFPERAQDREAFRKSLGVLPGDVIFVFVSVLSRQKGAHLALEGFAAFAKGRMDTRLIIVGDGPQLASLKVSVSQLSLESRVIFLGHRSRKDVAQIMAASDVFLMPTLRIEGLPYAAIEAALSQLPAIVTPRSGVREVFGENAIYVPLGDTGAIARAMKSLYGSAGMRSRLGQAAGARAQERFSKSHARESLAWLDGLV